MEWLVVFIVFLIIGIYLYSTEFTPRIRSRNKAILKYWHDLQTDELADDRSIDENGIHICVFCQGRKLTKQHFWPDWIKNVIPREGNTRIFQKQGQDHSDTNNIKIINEDTTQQGHPGTFKLRIVCASCNNGWMSRIEEDAKAVMVPLILNNPYSVSLENQSLLVKWAILATIIGEYQDDKTRAVARLDRKIFYETKKIPPGWKVWIAKNEGSVKGPAYAHSSLHIELTNSSFPDIVSGTNQNLQSSKKFNIQFSQFIIGSLQVFTSKALSVCPDFTFEGQLSGKLIQIFPSTQSKINWPECDPLTNKESYDLIEYFPKKHFRPKQS